MKNTIDNLELLSLTEDQLYRLRDEMTDYNEINSPINPMIDWIQKEKRRIENARRKKVTLE